MPSGNVDICRLDPPVDISAGKGKGRRNLRRPHFSTVRNIPQNVSRVKRNFLFWIIFGGFRFPHRHARNKSTAVRFRFSARAVRPWAGTMPGGAGLLRRSSPSQPSCPDLFRASTSRRRLARARLAPRCLTAWMPGTSPGMTRWGKAGRDWGRRRETPAYRNPSLDPRDPPETRSYSSLLPRPKELNRTAMEQVRA